VADLHGQPEGVGSMEVPMDSLALQELPQLEPPPTGKETSLREAAARHVPMQHHRIFVQNVPVIHGRVPAVRRAPAGMRSRTGGVVVHIQICRRAPTDLRKKATDGAQIRILLEAVARLVRIAIAKHAWRLMQTRAMYATKGLR
jgi:hypothetical protein